MTNKVMMMLLRYYYGFCVLLEKNKAIPGWNIWTQPRNLPPGASSAYETQGDTIWTHLELTPEPLSSEIVATARTELPVAPTLAHTTHGTPVTLRGSKKGARWSRRRWRRHRRRRSDTATGNVGTGTCRWGSPSEGPRRTVPTRFRRTVRHGR